MQNINWKELSDFWAYKAIKKCMIDAMNGRWVRDYNRKEAKRKFKWIIGRAMHYAYHKNTSILNILGEWEEARDCNWTSYYSDYNFPKLNKNKGDNGSYNERRRVIRYVKSRRGYGHFDAKTRRERTCQRIIELQARFSDVRRKKAGKKLRRSVAWRSQDRRQRKRKEWLRQRGHDI